MQKAEKEFKSQTHGIWNLQNVNQTNPGRKEIFTWQTIIDKIQFGLVPNEMEKR